MTDSKQFTFEEPTIEEIARRLALIYAPVSFSRHPMFSWVLVMNDVTILGEDLRRERRDEAVRRAAAVLVRLLEFIGYYTYVHEISAGPGDFSDVVARSLREDSYTQYIPDGLREGPTRWILMKYPFACSKCGREQCQCLLAPWVLENRRERPEEYFRRFQSQVAEARKRLKDRVLSELTLRSLIDHFGAIYRANYYHQDPWKIGMHLSEEMGEATTELGRMELQWRAQVASFNVMKEVPEILRIAADRVERNVANITEPSEREKHRSRMLADLEPLQRNLKKAPWETYGRLVADKFKEEVADILSWLAAIVVKLDPNLEKFRQFPRRFVQTGKGDVEFLGCPWCHEAQCSNACLVTHGISREIAESVLHF